jgi:uncharacterized membrane protein
VKALQDKGTRVAPGATAATELEEGPQMAKYARRRRRARTSSPEKIARGLGWFSVGIGIAQIAAPRLVSRLVGLPLPAALTVACGVRELVCGIGILTQQQIRPWMQARVAGDALDLAAFGAGLLLPAADRPRIAVATAAVAGVTALDVYCSRELAKDRRRPTPRHLKLAVNVGRAADELYRFWRDLRNLPRVMPQLEAVEALDGTRSRWVLKAPAGERIEWDAELIDDVPNERLAWRSVEGAAVYNAGSVQFVRNPSGGTDVNVDLLYEPPPESFGAAVALLFGLDPDGNPRVDLDGFKRLMESS